MLHATLVRPIAFEPKANSIGFSGNLRMILGEYFLMKYARQTILSIARLREGWKQGAAHREQPDGARIS